jgi:putative ABC transport system substrate-binding protein
MVDKACVLVVALVLGVFSAPRTIEAQGAAKVRKVGELHPGTGSAERLAALREAGYVEGQNLVVIRRHAEGRMERLPALAAELVDLKPDVILATGGTAIRAAVNATKVIPIVMAFGEDPVGKGLVASLARPGGNITGVTLVAAGTMAAKRIEVFKEAMPRAHRIALLSWPRMESAQVKEAEQAARGLKIETVLVEVRNGDYEGAFAALAAERADALFVLSSPLLNRDRKRIIALAARHRLPAFYEWRESAEEGGLLAYGANSRDLNRRVVALVDKILKGAKAGDLPVEQPMSFELVINMKTAKTLGLAIPPSLLARADYLVE